MRKVLIIIGFTFSVIIGLSLYSAHKNSVVYGDLLLENIESISQDEDGSAVNCRWSKESCGMFSGNREVCIKGGDGKKCDCGEVTRDC